MGLICLGKTMLRSGPLQGSGAPTSVRTAGLPSMGFLATFGARRFPKGNEGKRVSSGYNRRRRLATRSSGKQQAERTAVRTAPIVCPEESLLGARRRNPPFPDEGLTRRLRRGWWGCRPEGGSTFFRSERKYQRKHAARRLQRRPTSLCTAAKPCAVLGLGYALHGFQPFLALVGLRPPLVAGFGLREPLRGCPRPRLAALTRSWHWADLNGGAWDASERLGWLRSAKGQRGFQIMLACGASRRACRPTAVCARQQTGN